MKDFFKALGKAFLYFITYFSIQVILGFIIGIVFVVYMLISGDPSMTEEMMTQTLENNMATYTTALVLLSNIISFVFIWLFFIIRKKKLTDEIQLRKCNSKQILAAVMFGIGFSFLLGAVMEIIPFPESLVESFTNSHDELNMGNPVIGFISVALIGPIVEEIFFRGLVHTRLKKGMPTAVAVILSSLLFGVLHGESIWIIFAFLAGLALVWMFEKTGSLLCSIIVHIVNNAISQLTYYLPDDIPLWVDISTLAVCFVLFVASVLIIHKESANKAETLTAAEETV